VNIDTGNIIEPELVQAIIRGRVNGDNTPDALRRYREMRIAPTAIQLRRGRVGRNDPCLCGSGRKFKRCCWSGKARP
jgi:uncharacterized protein YecA (UPF0149 family)